MIIANFTDEPIEWLHGGEFGTLDPGSVTEFPDARGNHIFNSLTKRGLLKLTFDEANDMEARPEWVAKAKQINKTFWVRQVTDFNQLNESLKNENKPYIYPQPHVEKAAERLGIPLIGPWKVAEAKSTDDTKVKALESEISELKNMVSELLSGIAKKENDATREVELKGLYKDLDVDGFKKFVKDNFGTILGWPEKVRGDIVARWDRDIPDDTCPLIS